MTSLVEERDACKGKLSDAEGKLAEKFPRQPEGNGGWTFEFGFVRRIKERAAEIDNSEALSMEGVETVLRALEEDTTASLEAPEEKLYCACDHIPGEDLEESDSGEMVCTDCGHPKPDDGGE